jgi:hypothetical protein
VAWQSHGTWEPSAPMLIEKLKRKTRKSESREAVRRGGATRSSVEVREKRMERRGRVDEVLVVGQPERGGAYD